MRPGVAMAAALLGCAASNTTLAADAPAVDPSAAGYYVDWKAVRVPPPAPREESEGLYTCSIQREAADTTASRILAIAECAYPPRDLLAATAAEKGYEFGADTARVPLWWSRGKNARRMPYAATRAALQYYLELTRKYRENEHREPGMQPIFTSRLIYHASIEWQPDFDLGPKKFRDVWEAHVALSWTYDDGVFLPFVAVRRTVVLSRAGAILAVDGDGACSEEVSISANRSVGRTRQLMH